MAEARAADDVSVFPVAAVRRKTGSEASSLQTRCFQRLCGRRKQKLVFTQRYQRSAGQEVNECE
jgi:hypothetical protein